ncbi:MAG: endo alpha-1,4 polygalactosaminidase [Chloroflexota bacterium]
MKRRPRIFLTILILASTLAACSSGLPTPVQTIVPVTGSTPEHWTPPIQASWQIQHTGAIDTTLPVDIYNLDLFDTSPETLADLHARGVKVMCYFSAGTYENWRPDAANFPASILGNPLADSSDEQWLDIRGLQLLAPIMLERIALAAQKGCDGIDPDHVDGYANETGFPLTPDDQLTYNIFLANAAHQNGLGIGLKNDLAQIPMLVSYFDWALSEECFTYNECHLLEPFVHAGKSVFVIEYQLPAENFCTQSTTLNFNAIQKNTELDAFHISCQ